MRDTIKMCQKLQSKSSTSVYEQIKMFNCYSNVSIKLN